MKEDGTLEERGMDYDITTLKKGERLRWKGKGQLGRSPSYGKGGVVRTRGKD